MEFVKVESSQIDSVGFGDGSYGPETLGVRFKTKSGITEYHYQGVSSRTHQTMMGAESVGKYFGANIKGNPAHLFVKVEADPTNASTPARIVDAEKPVSTQSNGAESTTETDPGSALAEIDGLKPEFIFVPGNVDSILVKLRDEVLAMAKGLDPSTPAKQKRIREIKGLVVSRRTFIEKVRVGYVADLVLKKSVTDTVSKNVQARLSNIEDEILKVTGYAAWEQRVKDRKAKNEKIVLDINAMQPHIYPTIDSLILAIAQLNAIDTESMEELSELATGAKKQRLEMLTADLVKRQDAERDAAELAELRRKQAEREEADRKAEQQRQEDERIAAAARKLADEQIQQAVEAAKVETRQEVIAELAAPVDTAPFAADAVGRGIRLSEVDVYEPVVEELAENVETFIYPDSSPTPFRTGIVETHEQHFNREAVADMMESWNVDRRTAMRYLENIKQGLIAHISITY
jgi:hypothetical protein